ncbi:hypothetical protein ABVK25_002832 [Lepraria finkii]|uniref:Transposase n=1 Tax=Lepraria finkii TaxID=1340010 RepID=A0ABR4BHJ9_9LECA
MHPPTPEAQPNFVILSDCLSTPVIHRSAPKSSSGKRRRPKGRKSNVILSPSAVLDADTNDAKHLADFIDMR